MLDGILSVCQLNTRLCIACDISLATETIVTKTIASWKSSPLPDLHKRPTVFLILA
jgi:16S rRNA (cytidine1402-2'-O)-methyltransferase